MNIAEQLSSILDILKDYPGIEKTIDLDSAKSFFDEIATSRIGGIPSFKDIDSAKIAEFIKEEKDSVQDWMDALNNLEGVVVWDQDCEGKKVFIGTVPADLASHHCDDDSGKVLFLNFYAGNRAKFDKQKGTWEEVYLLVVKHVNDNLIVPDLPETGN